jgi:hypothetical protein
MIKEASLFASFGPGCRSTIVSRPTNFISRLLLLLIGSCVLLSSIPPVMNNIDANDLAAMTILKTAFQNPSTDPSCDWTGADVCSKKQQRVPSNTKRHASIFTDCMLRISFNTR